MPFQNKDDTHPLFSAVFWGITHSDIASCRMRKQPGRKLMQVK